MWWCDEGTHPVGEKLPNAFGLHDMHGNVWEWCEDVYDESFYGTPEAAGPDPVATSGSGLRILRGGSWDFYASDCRAACRYLEAPSPGRGSPKEPALTFDLGFRAAMPLP